MLQNRFCFCFSVGLKSEIAKQFILELEKLKTITRRSIKCIRSDDGTEFTNHTLSLYCEENSIIHQRSCTYTPSENGKAERNVRTLKETTRAILEVSQLKSSFWCYAAQYAAHIINVLPKKGQVISPFERVYLRQPNYNRFNVFGAK